MRLYSVQYVKLCKRAITLSKPSNAYLMVTANCAFNPARIKEMIKLAITIRYALDGSDHVIARLQNLTDCT